MYKNIYKYDDMKRSEHMAVRTTAGWYLWTHELMEVRGADAAAFLDYVCANPIANLAVGRERYTTMLDESAEIIDDVVVFRMAEELFWVSTLFVNAMKGWFDTHKGSYQIEYENITPKWHMFAVQGPRSRDIINALVAEPVDDQRFFSIRDNRIGELPVKINRAGFTGEKLGYEIYVAADQADAIEQALNEVGPKFDARQVTEFQVMAWTLPTEAGFYYMRDLRHTNPLEVGLDRGIGWDKDFIGKDALLKIREEGPAREMVGFTVEEADIHINGKHLGGPGEAVCVDGKEVGRVSKIVYGYVKDTNIGYILAKKGSLKVGDHVSIHGHEAVITEKSFL